MGEQYEPFMQAEPGRVPSRERVVYTMHWWARRHFRALLLATGCPYEEHRRGVFVALVTPAEDRWLSVNGGVS